MFFPPPSSFAGQASGPKLQSVTQGVRVLQIIVAALMLGVLTFGGVATFLAFLTEHEVPQPPAVPAPPMLAYLAAAFATVLFVVHLIVPMIVLRSSLQQVGSRSSVEELTPVDLVPSYIASTIVACALPEGAAFFNLVAVIIDRQYWSLGVAGAMLVLIAIRFPTVDGVTTWAEDKLRDMKMSGGA